MQVRLCVPAGSQAAVPLRRVKQLKSDAQNLSGTYRRTQSNGIDVYLLGEGVWDYVYF